jgi:hypothetical protein
MENTQCQQVALLGLVAVEEMRKQCLPKDTQILKMLVNNR